MAGVVLSACNSTTKTTTAESAATTTVGYPVLPDTIVTVPAPDAPDHLQGSIAEASAFYAVAEAQPQAGSALPGASPQQALVAGASPNETAETAAAVGSTASDAPGETVVLASAGPDAAAMPEVIPASFAGSSPNAGALAKMPLDPDAAAQKAMLIHAPDERLGPEDVDARSAELDQLMAKYAEHYDIPEELVRRVAKRESTFNPKARNGPYWGLMQIRHDTARGMGYDGTPTGLLDAETNLKYAVRYLRGAWLVAKGNLSVADKLYQRGYYYDAKRAGLLDETGLGKDRRRRNPS